MFHGGSLVAGDYKIIDAFCCPGPTSVHEPGAAYTLDDLLKEHSRYGIAQRLCMHAESRDGVPDEGNSEMTRLAKDAPGTTVIWTALPPRRFHAEPVTSVIEKARKAGVAALALYPKRQLHHLAPWANDELYRAMEEARLPLVLDWEQIDVRDLYDVAKAYPRLPILVWGAHYRTDRYLIPIMDLCENVYVGLATRFVQTGGIEDFCERYGPGGRLIYGSGWPAQSPGMMISCVTYATVDDESKTAILSGNVKRILADVAWPVQGFEE